MSIESASRELVEVFVAAYARDPGRFCSRIDDDGEMLLFDLPRMGGDRERAAIHYLAQGRRICGDLGEVGNCYLSYLTPSK